MPPASLAVLLLGLILLVIHMVPKSGFPAWPSILCLYILRLLVVVLVLLPGAVSADGPPRGPLCWDDQTRSWEACPTELIDIKVVAEKEKEPTPVKPVERFCFETKGPNKGAVVDCPRTQLRLAGGALRGTSTAVEAELLPAFSIHVDSQLTRWREKGPRLLVDGRLDGLPGAEPIFDPTSTELFKVEAVKALDVSAGILQPLGDTLQFNAYARLGFATRLSGSTTDSERLPGYMELGLDFHTASGEHWLQLGFGPDQRLSGFWWQTFKANGAIQLASLLQERVRAWLQGWVIRGVASSTPSIYAPTRDWWSISVQVGVLR